MKTLLFTLILALGLCGTTARLESNETQRDPIAWIIDRTGNAIIYTSMIRILDISDLRGKYRVVKEIDYSKVQDWDRAYFVHTKSGGATMYQLYEVVKCYVRKSCSESNYYFNNYSGSWYGFQTSPDTNDLINIGSEMGHTIVEHWIQ